MTHTIIVRPASDFEPHIDGIVNHAVQIAEGAEIITESTDYLRRLGEALIARADRVDGKPAELQRPGTWLPGDQVIDEDGDTWTRGERDWKYKTDQVFGAGDSAINSALKSGPGYRAYCRITHLVPRTDGAR